MHVWENSRSFDFKIQLVELHSILVDKCPALNALAYVPRRQGRRDPFPTTTRFLWVSGQKNKRESQSTNKTTCQMKWCVLHAGNSIDISCKHILSIPWRKCLPVSRWAPACCCSMSFLFSHHTHSTSLDWKNTLDIDFGLDLPTAQSI